MTFEILLSTMNEKFFKRTTPPKIPEETSVIVINQYSTDTPSITKVHAPFKLLSFSENGLAKSRNHALENATADIALISDDDLEYLPDMKQTILNAFKENPEADIITFQIKTPDGQAYKQYKNAPFTHSIKSLMRVSSVEIAFRPKCIKKMNLSFDEKFGLGSDFPTGEEIIFLTDALKKGLKLLYYPQVIVIHPLESSGKNYHNQTLVQAKGAMFYRVFGKFGYLLSILFAYRKYKQSPHSWKQFISIMFTGIKKYKESSC